MPTERERTQWYLQRYVEQLPAAGETVPFDRSWFSRAGVEHVMGFCTTEEYRRFLHQCPIVERMLVEDGIRLRKYWFSVSDAEQERRFRKRLSNPPGAGSSSPWTWVHHALGGLLPGQGRDVRAHRYPRGVRRGERRQACARINMMAHLLSTVPYGDVRMPDLSVPPRPPSTGYERPPKHLQTHVPDHVAWLASQDPPAS